MASSASVLASPPGRRQGLFLQKAGHTFPESERKIHKKVWNAYEVRSDHHNALDRVFRDICRKNGIVCDNALIFEYLQTFEDKEQKRQLSLF
jgi:hypothetical protein